MAFLKIIAIGCKSDIYRSKYLFWGDIDRSIAFAAGLYNINMVSRQIRNRVTNLKFNVYRHNKLCKAIIGLCFDKVDKKAIGIKLQSILI